MDESQHDLEDLGKKYHEVTAEILSSMPVEAQVETLRIMFSSLLAIFLANKGHAETSAFLRRMAQRVELDAQQPTDLH